MRLLDTLSILARGFRCTCFQDGRPCAVVTGGNETPDAPTLSVCLPFPGLRRRQAASGGASTSSAAAAAAPADPKSKGKKAAAAAGGAGGGATAAADSAADPTVAEAAKAIIRTDKLTDRQRSLMRGLVLGDSLSCDLPIEAVEIAGMGNGRDLHEKTVKYNCAPPTPYLAYLRKASRGPQLAPPLTHFLPHFLRCFAAAAACLMETLPSPSCARTAGHEEGAGGCEPPVQEARGSGRDPHPARAAQVRRGLGGSVEGGRVRDFACSVCSACVFHGCVFHGRGRAAEVLLFFRRESACWRDMMGPRGVITQPMGVWVRAPSAHPHQQPHVHSRAPDAPAAEQRAERAPFFAHFRPTPHRLRRHVRPPQHNTTQQHNSSPRRSGCSTRRNISRRSRRC